MRAIKKYKLLLTIKPWDGQIYAIDVYMKLGYQRPSSAAKILMELYKNGDLKREEAPKNMLTWGKKPTGGHKYKYTITEKGWKKIEWIQKQGYFLKDGELYRYK